MEQNRLRQVSACWPGWRAPAVAGSRSTTSSGTGCLPGSATGGSPSRSSSLKTPKSVLLLLLLLLLPVFTQPIFLQACLHSNCAASHMATVPSCVACLRLHYYLSQGHLHVLNSVHSMLREENVTYTVYVQKAQAVREEELPLTLPPTQDFKPSGRPESPLAKISDWVQTTDPSTGVPKSELAATGMLYCTFKRLLDCGFGCTCVLPDDWSDWHDYLEVCFR